jgi:uracil-DNA glycosylase
MASSENSKRKALLELAHQIDANRNWWRFPEETPIQGFLGASSIVIVGDQPSTSSWPESHPNRRAFYDTLKNAEASDAHLTDLYKKRGRSSALRKGLPNDFQEHLSFFRREIKILQPTRVVAVGKLAYDLMFQHLEELRPMLGLMWHFSFVVRSGLLNQYEANMRRAIWRTQL